MLSVACTVETASVPVSDQAAEPATTTTMTELTTTTTEPTTTTTVDPVIAQIDGMSVEQKVGQLLMPVMAGISALHVTPAEAQFNLGLAGYETPSEIVQAYHLGGIMYLGPNVESPEQVELFSRQLNESVAARGDIALLIAADQEGGRVRRIRGEGITVIESARSFAGDLAAITEAGRLTADELGQLGINMILAPVADVASGDAGVIGDRSYSDDPEVVAAAASASSVGIQRGGGLSVVKHWPGHGATTIDSHKSLPEILATLDVWRERDGSPFETVIASGVDAVMVGHLAFPELDTESRPATVSPVLVEDLLRSTYGFDRLVITDAMDMGAVSGYERGELAVLAIEAGIDILLGPPDLAVAHAALLEAVASGRISGTRLDASVERVLRAKAALAQR
jgi:beta-N-acetylhexosaminidase